MSTFIPPKVTIYAHVNWRTSRLTGKTFTLPAGAIFPGDLHPGEWVALDHHSALWLMNGTTPWHEWARVGSRVMHLPDMNLDFLSRISPAAWPEIALLDPKWTPVKWLPLDVPRIEPDDWELFWKLWNEKQSDITRGLKETQFWKGLCCYLNPEIDHTKFNYKNTVIDDWTNHFPKMFQQLFDCLPFHSIEKVVLWSNINEVTPHIDPDAVIYPWPDSLRVMIWDTNDGPTFWISEWPERTADYDPKPISVRTGAAYGVNAAMVPHEKRTYVDLPPDTNTFVFNNGAFLHGADLAKPKIIMAIKGRPKINEWLKALEPSYNKYKDWISK
jgi:hypothetical protein